MFLFNCHCATHTHTGFLFIYIIYIYIYIIYYICIYIDLFIYMDWFIKTNPSTIKTLKIWALPSVMVCMSCGELVKVVSLSKIDTSILIFWCTRHLDKVYATKETMCIWLQFSCTSLYNIIWSLEICIIRTLGT